ncbi:hypothetical protein ACFPES_15620 [Paenibacillus sp. GCM10023248]|uniref:hypothetical protein n=1 Tax=Bacillales TaxID=1385 RepID=UPI002378A5DD|nr:MULTISPECIES: hypothetical protein [Bacillales]MDD9268470.1 hypothetical protein [Paenibacillus sp. MAHUQ-63]MDR6879359.1 hypothetical protein [Bacillus sp. 3255]
MRASVPDPKEITISQHTKTRWHRRGEELLQWMARDKNCKRPKRIAAFENSYVDEELVHALTLLNRKGIVTEYSCAGVSPLDEPEDHSLYAYMTLHGSDRSLAFIQAAMKRMKHRILVSFEPERNRYDLSSFYIGHNRTFCRLIQACAEDFPFAGVSE